jgi:endonuclease YncB( thermonuclease family)
VYRSSKVWRLVLLLLGMAMAHAAEREASAVAVLAGKVVRVLDGDTIDVLLSSGTIRVRMHGVDAPERDQPGGPAATAWLTQQLRDRKVLLEPVSQDQYDRMVAVVHRDDRNINRDLVQMGHAWAYRQYLRSGDAELCALEEQARRKGIGLWVASAHAPWEFRATNGKGPFTSFDGSTARECGKGIGRQNP